MMLIINICKEPLHELEFVRPLENILKNKKVKFFTRHYKKISKKDLSKSDKVIICGTSLKDNDFISNIGKFNWIKTCNKPVLGICGGMQAIGIVFGGKLKRKQEIGLYDENFNKKFLGIKGKKKVYHLHDNYVTLPKEFCRYTSSEIPQAIKHKTRPVYGVLFHPEARNKEMIMKFAADIN